MTSRTEHAIVSRLAPSPTGFLHLGHARTFLLAWWHARSRGGRVVLRMEDLDSQRVKPGMAEQVLRDLEWLGLDWDGPVWVQSAHQGAFAAAIEDLFARGLAYACACSRRDVRAAQSAPHADEATPRYPGTCRGRFASIAAAEREAGRPVVLRFRVPPGALGSVRFVDEFAGEQAVDVDRDIGDFPIAVQSRQATYQLAVVVDDARNGVTEVLRGDDLLSSTPRQYLVQEALGLAHPAWIHVPLVVDETGRRLAKRSDDLALRRLRTERIDPRRLVAWIAARSGIEVDGPCTAAEAGARFSLARVPREPVRWTARDLDLIRDAR